MKARLRDFLENKEGWIFAVADYNQTQGIRCMLRYIPDHHGERQSKGKKYRKLDFDEAFAFLRRERPSYVQDLHVVPEKDIAHIFRPNDGLKHIVKMDSRVRKLATLFADAGVPQEEMGVTGSMLLGLHSPLSDIDFVVYGPWWWKARDILAKSKEMGFIQDLDETMWHRIYSKREPETSFEEFVLHEERKGNRGVIDGTYFDLLFTRQWNQIKPYPLGKQIGKRKITATVIDADFAFDSPAVYKLDHNDVKEIYCYSHTYAGQALEGEEIEAMGVIEETYYGLRLIVGTTRQARGEWIRSMTLLENKNKKPVIYNTKLRSF
ncbi:MAG: nucleotidyltransferase domain-containing protein [Methanotrichaceae archaeon]|nr:nucleotidyltransferase domain-containing protein [Methanotrichaceae archaeon]